MATEANGPAVGRFVTAVLPWIVGVGAFLVYGLTLDPWVSLYSLGTVARVSGWTWQPELYHPLTAVVLWPFGLLPEAWIPLALNLFTAACAALVLVLLARTVALLPHDPSPGGGGAQSSPLATLAPRTAWMAPVLAVMACGLQSTFWEHAASGTGEMIDLLLFAYIVRCLLEFRTDRNESWLTRSAFLYGAGMANNWALIVYLPLFIVAIFRLNGLQESKFSYRILNPRFLLGLCLWGLAGLSLYLLLPGLCSLSSVHHLGFWTALKGNLRFQKENVRLFLRTGLGLLALTTYLPLLAISFRWKLNPSQSGDDNALGRLITRAAIHVVHAVFLAASLWLMLDPPFSPRTLGYGASPLAHYYLSALVAGYCAGYFLAIASQAQTPRSRSRVQMPGGVQDLPTSLAISAVWALLVAVPLALTLRNLSQIRATNGPALREFARQSYNALPAGKSVVLSDDPTELYLLRAEQASRGRSKAALLLDTRWLGSGQYQDFVARRFKARWPATPGTNRFEELKPPSPLALLSALSTSEPLFYLHPSFDYCFEPFAERSSGPIRRLLARPATEALGQGLDEHTAATNEQYWQQRWTTSLQALARQTGERGCQPSLWVSRLFTSLHLKAEQNRTMSFLGAAYARCLNDWGVRMQRLGQWKEAGLWFQRALELNPANLSAQINLEYNQRHQRGDPAPLIREAVEVQFADLFRKYRTWEPAVRDNGPVDEPTYLCRTAGFLWVERNHRQAAGEFLRCVELAPDWLEPKLGLAESYVILGDFANGMRLAETLSSANPPLTGLDEARLVSCRARALQGLGRRKEATACIEGFVRQHQEQPEVLSTAMQLYLQCEQYALALPLLDQLLSREPDNPGFLQSKGIAHIGLWQWDAAIATLTRALALDPSNPGARINRAIARLHAGHLEDARADYQELLKRFPNAFQVLYGLAEIASRKQDTNTAIEFYQRYLANGLPESDEYKLVSYRLKSLQPR
jgi:tetratricopeptide (TPR) repeat protein